MPVEPSPAASPAPGPPVPSWRDAVVCRDCGYALDSLPPQAGCPECGGSARVAAGAFQPPGAPTAAVVCAVFGIFLPFTGIVAVVLGLQFLRRPAVGQDQGRARTGSQAAAAVGALSTLAWLVLISVSLAADFF